MAEHTAAPADPAEDRFRQENRWHSFKATLYGAFSTAAFIGLLGSLVNRMLESFTSQPPPPLNLGGYAVMGSMLAMGTLFTFLSVSEWTEAGCIRDAHMARKNAECMAHQRSAVLDIAPSPAIEQKPRADGKTWVQATAETTPECQRVM